MRDQPSFDSFGEFYPYYLSQHSKFATRVVHSVGTGLAVALAIKALTFGPRKQVLAAPIVGYGTAWLSHFLIEKNKPASFGYPLYSALGDFRMMFDMARGQNVELHQIAAETLARLESANSDQAWSEVELESPASQ